MPRRLAVVASGILLVGTAAVSGAPSATRVIYRCTAADGAVALQDAPCPAGQRQERRDVAAFAPPTVSASGASGPASAGSMAAISPAMPRDPAAANAGPAASIDTAAPPAPRPSFLPPPLWRCTDFNDRSRLAEFYDPQPRCVPLSVLGIDLSRAPPSAATLCRTVEDDCVELRGDAACDAWRERLKAAESALRSAFSDTQAARLRERDRAKAVVDNDCRA